mmetsp:Transcript_19609/g.18689  ORF Transcript_19609/g.18689 Transcript_19609/m.18689 type:complete len:245 (+) Transcript_19609:634-1368(+)
MPKTQDLSFNSGVKAVVIFGEEDNSEPSPGQYQKVNYTAQAATPNAQVGKKKRRSRSKKEESYSEPDFFEVFMWNEFLTLSKDVSNASLFDRMQNQRPGMCCNIVYKGFNYGRPRGVMLSHDNMTWYWKVFADLQQERGEEGDYPIYVISYIPLCHILPQMIDFARLIVNNKPLVITFARMKETNGLQGLIETLKEVKPTEFLAHPSIFEQIRSVINTRISASSVVYQRMYNYARKKGYENVIT